MTLGFPKVETVAAGAPADEWTGHLARELHDLVAQPLISLVLEIHEFASRAEWDEAVASDVARLEDSARAVLRTTRELMLDLRGHADIRLNFREMLKNELLRNSLHPAGILPTLRVSSTWPQRINGWAAFNLLRIVQEAVANALRHGRASRVDIILSTSPGQEAVVVVLDDGAGLGDAPPGSGMVGMNERAVILGGKFTVVPTVVGGTRVEVRVPLDRLE